MEPEQAASLESAVVVVVDAPALEAVYRDAYPNFFAVGIPLHVTLLYPFVPPSDLDRALPRLRELLARQEPFAFALTEIRTFPDAVWVAPEPAAPFQMLTEAIEVAFPQYPHWGGRFDEVIPHMTLVAELGDENELAAALARLRPRVQPFLPVQLSADEATVLAERPDGQWVTAAQLRLGVEAAAPADS